MAQYLIEFRFQSKRMQTYLKSMIYGINRKFGVGRRKHVPHITLVGPIITRNERRLIADFARICSKTGLMKFKGDGFGTFESNRVVFVNVIAGEKLNEFRINLVDTLRSYCNLQSQDKRKELDRFGYHSTLAMKLDQNEFNLIKSYIKNKPAPNFTQIVMRVTLLKGGRILREYDFLQRRLLNRRQALNKHITRRSKTLLREFMRGRYNPNNKIKSIARIKNESFIVKIKRFLGLR
jgi:2'-5' RNA ligase